MGLRASDNDRERVVDFLRRQQALGRLTVDELEERSAAAWAAVEVAQLEALTADLPRETAVPVPAKARRPPRLPGSYGFTASWHAPARRERAMGELIAHVSPALQAYGFDVVERTEGRVVFRRRRTPAWVVFPIVLLFPFGLLALLAKTEDRIAIELVERQDGTLIVASGVAPLSARRAFAELESD